SRHVTMEPKDVGRRMAAARKARGWTQLAFALEADVSPSTVTRWEAGHLPPVRELRRVADVLGLPPAELVEGGEQDRPLAELVRERAELVRELRGEWARLADRLDALERNERRG